jgi:hypothetical protein
MAMLVAGFIAWTIVNRSRPAFQNPLSTAQFTRLTNFEGAETNPAISPMGNSSPSSPTVAVRLTSGSFKATAAASRISAKVGSEMCADLFVP